MVTSQSAPPGTVDVEHLWKRFRADRSRRYFRDRMLELRPKHRRDRDRWRWVLKDLDLHLPPGDAVGLIGANGSGKSTLLKIMTGVMYPYAGTVAVHGRVGALLEVRAGLHGDLSGRENVYLYGALIGLTKKDIDTRFDEIVDFAVLADAIDRQVKFYSSGMQMRLGFAVAAFLEPNVLLVDEALAVGDAFFQQRCLDRMRELLRMGTTLVLVSHDLAAVESVCTRGVWLVDGEIREDGPVHDTLLRYREWVEVAYHDWMNEQTSDAIYRSTDVQIVKCEVSDPDRAGEPSSQGPAIIDLVLDSPTNATGILSVGVSEGTASPLFVESSAVPLQRGPNRVRCAIPFLPIPSGRFYIWIQYQSDENNAEIPWQPAGDFRVAGARFRAAPTGVMRSASIQLDAEWELGDAAP